MLVVGLVVAAFVLLGAIAWIAVGSKSGQDDGGPASVRAGSENREYEDEPAPKATASATAKPAPKPVHRPAPVRTTPKVAPKQAPPRDIYDDLD